MEEAVTSDKTIVKLPIVEIRVLCDEIQAQIELLENQMDLMDASVDRNYREQSLKFAQICRNYDEKVEEVTEVLKAITGNDIEIAPQNANGGNSNEEAISTFLGSSGDALLDIVSNMEQSSRFNLENVRQLKSIVTNICIIRHYCVFRVVMSSPWVVITT